MKLMKLKLLIVALVLLVANSAFAALSYNVSIDTSSLNGSDGYLYFQYMPVNAISSSATVSGFTGGTLASANDTLNIVDGSTVTGMLPGSVVFGNTSQSATNDYNHAIHFGNSLSFLVSFNNYLPGGQAGGSSTFSLGLFQDAQGSAALLGGTLFTIDLMNDGSTSAAIIANQASATPTPIPAAFWLLGSGLAGLAGLRRKAASI